MLHKVRRLQSAGAVALLSLLQSSAPAAEPPARRVQPTPPEQAHSEFVIDSACRIELVAAEPLTIDPVSLAFDERGRMWVVEYTDYPNGPAAGAEGLSRIRILTDSNADGRYDSVSTFAEKLLFANGLMPWRDGVLVTTDGKLVHLRDTTGDGRADQRDVWFEGFAVGNPQLRANHPTLGPDNKIYVASGLRGGAVKPGRNNPWGLKNNGPPVSISGRDFRFDPLTGAHEAISGVAQFGLTFDAHGRRFVCSNRNPCLQIVLESEDLKRAPWVRATRVAWDASPAAERSRLYPLSYSWTTSNLHANQFTAACGVIIDRGNALPAAYRGHSWTCEPTGNLIHRSALTSHGLTFVSPQPDDQTEFLATRDDWFRPVDLTFGPDGALYVCDMYRAVIEHPEFMPTELQDRPDLMWGRDCGRIWRIAAVDAGAAAMPARSLAEWSSEQLVGLLSHPIPWQRDTARRLLLERGDPQSIRPLKQLLQTATPNTPVESITAVVALLASMNSLVEGDAAYAWGLAGRHQTVARMIRSLFPESQLIANRRRQMAEELFAQGGPQNRGEWALLHNLLLTGRWSDWSGEHPDSLLKLHWLQLANHVELQADGFFPVLLALHAGEELPQLCRDMTYFALRSGAAPKSGLKACLSFCMESLARRGREGEQRAVLEVLLATETPDAIAHSVRRTALAGLIQGATRGPDTVRTLLGKLSAPAQAGANASLTPLLATDPDQFVASHVRLLALLNDTARWDVLRQLANSADSGRSAAAITLLQASADDAADRLLHELLETRSPQLRRQAITALTMTPERVRLLIEDVRSGRVRAAEVDSTALKRIQSWKDAKLQALVAEHLTPAPPADREQVLAEYAAALSLSAAPERGREIFIKQCAQCHQIGEWGVNVGPDISDSRTKTPEFLLTNILDPNRAIDANYFSFSVVDLDGRVETGLIATETGTSLTLKQPEGRLVSFAREDIEEIRNNGTSLMPTGLERTISVEQMADLISFIKNWRYLDGATPEEVIRNRATSP